MATNEEMSLARQVLQLGMTITAQGRYKLNVEYHGHVDHISVFGFTDGGEYLKGWAPSDHGVYLGSFHQSSPFSRTKNNAGVNQLKKLLKDMDKLLKKDADGIPM